MLQLTGFQPKGPLCLVYDKLPPIPPSIGKLGELVELTCHLSIKELPESIGGINKLKFLRLTNSKIKRLPSSIGKLQSLQEFNAYGSTSLEGEIHVDKGGLSSLKTLNLSFTKISGLPENLDQLSSLERLGLRSCGELESLPKPPCSLSIPGLTCRSNELPSLSPHLKHLFKASLPSKEAHACMSLQSIPELPSYIQKLYIWGCPKLDRFPKLSDLEFLSKLVLMDCYRLKKLDGLEALKTLRELNLCTRPMLIIQGTTISNLEFEKVDNLHVIRGLEKLGSLEWLDISGREHIQVLDLSKSEHLKCLDVCYCESLVEIRCPSKFWSTLIGMGASHSEITGLFTSIWLDFDEE
ncbi:plant intracellular Ras-group-related LRR protein 4-like [Eucalyptus grandis]|uniref:plant intracellular Ras-group-related LRR protein 4-like n=1 Tax=Eucalyptus grandis TaxID=71139 RepID=UPI00192EC72E|nr:plant intracellular Ras-group-related LRR protein 4-like [Eucalyptus grandis]